MNKGVVDDGKGLLHYPPYQNIPRIVMVKSANIIQEFDNEQLISRLGMRSIAPPVLIHYDSQLFLDSFHA